MKQKELYLADLNPIKGQEQKGIRPVVIVSGPSMNSYFRLVTVCPLSSKVKNYPACVVLKHIRTISKDRLVKKLGEISGDQLEEIFRGLFEILRY